MTETKHVGRIKANKEKVAVVYRTLPSDPKNALIIVTASLSPEDHDSLINLIDSNAGQTSYELAEAMARTRLKDGSNMLAKFHARALMKKVPTSEIEMTPTANSAVSLDALNAAIAQQKGVNIAELSIKPDVGNTESLAKNIVNPIMESVRNETVLTDEQLAAKLRSDADRLYKEAAQLRKQADELKNKSAE